MKISLLTLILSALGWNTLIAQRSFNIQINSDQPPLLEAFAGEDITLNFDTPQLGGSPSALGGTEPYNYQRSPSYNLNDPSETKF